MKPKPGKPRVQALCSFTSPCLQDVGDGLWKYVHATNQGKVADELRKDWCIMELGKHLYSKYSSAVKMHEYTKTSGDKSHPLTVFKILSVQKTSCIQLGQLNKQLATNEDTGTHTSTPSTAVKLGLIA